MNYNEVIKSARKMCFDKNKEKIKRICPKQISFR